MYGKSKGEPVPEWRRKEILWKLRTRINEIRKTQFGSKILRGRRIYVVGSLLGNFREDSDIDIWVVPTSDVGSLTYEEQRKLKEMIGTIDGHKVHVFSPWGWLLVTDWRREKIPRKELV